MPPLLVGAVTDGKDSEDEEMNDAGHEPGSSLPLNLIMHIISYVRSEKP
jgi:hypothetical protein